MDKGDNVFIFLPELLTPSNAGVRIGTMTPAWLPDSAIAFNPREKIGKNGIAGRFSIENKKGAAIPGIIVKSEIHAASQYAFLKVLTENAKIADTFVPRYISWPLSENTGIFENSGVLDALKAVLPDSVNAWIENGISVYADAIQNKCAAYLIDHIFTYGTLMTGKKGHELINPSQNLISLEEGDISGVIYQFEDYPGLMVPEKGPVNLIKGELMRLRNISEILDILDDYEDFNGYGKPGSLYYRGIARVNGKPAWVYVLAETPSGVIKQM